MSGNLSYAPRIYMYIYIYIISNSVTAAIVIIKENKIDEPSSNSR